MIRPIAVIISDVHYNIHTLKLADAAMRQAVDKANKLFVPLVVAGDLHDTKSHIRGECINAMMTTFALLDDNLRCFILRGNHDAINEKSEEHTIEFLNKGIIYDEEISGEYSLPHEVIVKPDFTNHIAVNSMSVHFIPYQHDTSKVLSYLKKVDKGSCIIMHQGIVGSNAGDYIQDKSAITPQDVAGFRVISGHYHTRQTIEMPQGGIWDYIGNPFTLTYGEANDPPKGFQILMSDGSLEFVPTNLRRHIVIDMKFCTPDNGTQSVLLPNGKHPGVLTENDLVWIKVRGNREELNTVNKESLSRGWKLKQPFKLDLIPTGTNSQVSATQNLTKGPLLDSLIDSLTNTSDERKIRLKDKWKALA